MKRKTIQFEIDLAHPPALSEAQKMEKAFLKAQPEGEIDYSEIPPLGDAFWKNAVRNPFYRHTKTSTTVRIDSDVLLWLRAQGKGYQSLINDILRRVMLESAQSPGGDMSATKM
jgi:uncharacterized protein (DUF4415 family)